MRINYEQKFHPIGQGLFYSSSLQSNKISVNMIFDCGSDNIKLINNKIDQYGSNDIDILIISHLHYDHVSGLEHLLKNRIVYTVILPYLFFKERFLLWLFNKNKPEWYKTFLINPYSYLNENRNIKKIIVINGGGDNSNNYSINFPDEFPPLNDNLLREKNIQIKLEDTSGDIRSQIEKDGQIKFDDKKLLLKEDKGYILISQMYFSFFNYKINDDEKVIAFKREIEELEIDNIKSLLGKLKNAKKHELIKKSYEILRKDLNITSLAAYQGFALPFKSKKHSNYIFSVNFFQDVFINNLFCNSCDCFCNAHFHCRFIKKKYKCEIYFDCFSDCHKHCNCSKMIGTLLLGDIKLDYKTAKQKEMFFHFKNLLPSVKLVQLSHHGAKNGWNDDLVNKIQGSSIYIAVHGTNNKYHHPHKNVLIKLAESNRKLISVTERNEYYSRISFNE